MEREVGGGIGMGNTCKPRAVSFQCMTKSTTNKKKKKRRNGAETAREVGEKSGPSMFWDLREEQGSKRQKQSPEAGSLWTGGSGEKKSDSV